VSGPLTLLPNAQRTKETEKTYSLAQRTKETEKTATMNHADVVVMVDVENSCQDFLKGVRIDKDDIPSRLEVHLFMAHDTQLTPDQLPPWLEKKKEEWVHRAETNGKEAADITLSFFAWRYFLDDNARGSYYNRHCNARNVVLVHGGDKGYGELEARLRKALGEKFTTLDSSKTKLVDVPGISSTAGKCDCALVFRDSCDRDRHVRAESCNLCKHQYRCAAEQKHIQKGTCSLCLKRYRRAENYWPEGYRPELGYTSNDSIGKMVSFCDIALASGAYKRHEAQEHPTCDHCKFKFVEPAAYGFHRRQIDAGANHCHEPECCLRVTRNCRPLPTNRNEWIAHRLRCHRDMCKPCAVEGCHELLTDKVKCKNHCRKHHKDLWTTDHKRLQVFA
jgi:hypothetical protein